VCEAHLHTQLHPGVEEVAAWQLFWGRLSVLLSFEGVTGDETSFFFFLLCVCDIWLEKSSYCLKVLFYVVEIFSILS
jgi:hypothetical protein